jgi:AcrR family transcriptional regulator
MIPSTGSAEAASNPVPRSGPTTADLRGTPMKPIASGRSPRTDRGRKTRALLVKAARRAFERKGYVDTRVVDITKSGRVAIGTFYQYFDSKEAIFRAVVAELDDELWATVTDTHSSTAIEAIERSNRRFLELYRTNAELMAVIEQAAMINSEFREIRRRMRFRNADRIAASIRRFQSDGMADATLDARCAATALISMVSNFAYGWLVLGDDFDEEVATATLNRMWIQSIGLTNSLDLDRTATTGLPSGER